MALFENGSGNCLNCYLSLGSGHAAPDDCAGNRTHDHSLRGRTLYHWATETCTPHRKWQNSAPKVAELCHKSGRILAEKWQNSGRKVAEFCHKSGRILAQKWQNSGTKVAEFWQESGRILPQKWQNSGRKVAQFWQKSGTILPRKLHNSATKVAEPKRGCRDCLYISNLGTARGPWRFPSRKCGSLPSGIEPGLGQNSATFLAEFCHFCGRILPLLCQNSATFVPEFCHFCGRILPLLCQNSATFVAQFCHCSAITVPLWGQNHAAWGVYLSRWLSGRAHVA